MKQFSYQFLSGYCIPPSLAGNIVNTARRYNSDIFFYCNDIGVDGKKLFRLMGLRFNRHKEIFVLIRGRDEAEAMRALRNTLDRYVKGMANRLPALPE